MAFVRLRTLAPKKGSGSVSIPYRVSKRTSVSCVFVCSCAATPGIFVPERKGVQPSLHPIPLHIERCWSAGPGANVSDGPSHAKHVKTGRQVGQNTGTYDIVPPGSMLPSAEPSHCARVCVCVSLSLSVGLCPTLFRRASCNLSLIQQGMGVHVLVSHQRRRHQPCAV